MKRASKGETQFAICIKNRGYPASLELRKLYPVVSDPAAARVGQMRVVDESGEDYLYPEGCFVRVKLPPRVKQALLVGS